MRHVVFVTVTALVLAAARTLDADDTSSTVPFRRAIRIMPAAEALDFIENRLVESTLRETSRRSATFAEMLRALDGLRDVIVYLQTATLEERGLHGRARFGVARSGVLVGLITIHRFRPAELKGRIRAIAHELAHAFEAACLTHRATTSALHEALAARATSYGRKGSAETPFPRAVETAVLDEWFRQQPTTPQIDALALEYGLTECPRQAAAR